MIDTVYYELSWSILSTIGIANALFGLMVAGITSFGPVSIVPIVTSAAGAIANGLCYYAFYDKDTSATSAAIASIFADILWLWIVFATLYWSMILSVTAIRVVIAAVRARRILQGLDDDQSLINHLHMGYFILIALLECVSSFFLLRVFGSAKSTSLSAAIKAGLFRYLMRSTEVRLALLAVLGVMRAITYSFQNSQQMATNLASQIDRFAYSMECMFPVMMIIDILASKVVFHNQVYGSSGHSRNHPGGYPRQRFGGNGLDIVLTTQQGENIVEVRGGESSGDRTGSQERIISRAHRNTSSDIDMDEMDTKQIGISKTVEFEVRTSSDPAR
ncbi:hypothetical protein SNK03_005689 [Fusarium graminearum]|uniref:hypothetical protein n=1 Tax=Gibberella zeae (strain ATCC MYA-4620 / CBS 123657 / FGSC 9075 / NRRL 31084 / PH-1) TaxID=229533 RepID=UPI00021F1952|nr:hypothetical protein FGSG_03099 [Fusarium graminearum PH-1]ESU10175.1 hypothetical protein FGSG_03099 [Fusarium graminearum PH-1]EYB25501.1 hypothetical protein FG05_03099 [Fusarium graminearum]|eukprot:XP_011322674.1 hypothetical protein FGSG_03099 [Fusarium graminearum PH-1]